MDCGPGQFRQQSSWYPQLTGRSGLYRSPAYLRRISLVQNSGTTHSQILFVRSVLIRRTEKYKNVYRSGSAEPPDVGSRMLRQKTLISNEGRGTEASGYIAQLTYGSWSFNHLKAAVALDSSLDMFPNLRLALEAYNGYRVRGAGIVHSAVVSSPLRDRFEAAGRDALADRSSRVSIGDAGRISPHLL